MEDIVPQPAPRNKRTFSEEHRRKLSEARKGKKLSPEHVEKMAASKRGKPSHMKGKTHTEETKAKIREARKRQVITDETRQKLSKAGKARKLSEEHKRKISEAQKGKPRWDEEGRAMMARARKGRKFTEEQKAKRKKFRLSDETKAKMSASRKGRKISEATRAKISATEKGKHVSEDTRGKLSIARKGIPNLSMRGYKHNKAFRNRASANNVKRWQTISEDAKREHLDKLHKGGANINNSWIEDYYAGQLDRQGILYERQKRIGWYRVDFYIPNTNKVIEVQGCYWHCCEQCGHANAHEGKREADKKRHDYLLRKGFDLELIWEHDLPRKPYYKQI